ncbi:transmembrane amino acid transporter protein-domain-containing protein [Boeremia exigua]|uniref:transmembrane amino acid transporter protein-domain-containing protein n=1 Tax=Boeremia exigua TaxID=749465 RepID=UPI001E8CBC77|nr:transmembrane amino acid transporter protein-domain-containing protein [Boeremia exigua]KAH6639706.1 transmembrane amino acid transporter protein-domain-containing protein [Boeremia exigua]
MSHSLSRSRSSKRRSVSAGSTRTEREKTVPSNTLDVQQVNTSSDIEEQISSTTTRNAFGNEEGADIHYETLMLAENVSLGVLALPQALAILGIVPGLICICFLGLIATYTGWLIGEFKLAYPRVQSFPDCGELIAGPVGREIMAVGSILILVFVSGAHVLTFSVALNALTGHGACTIIFAVAGMVICFILGLPRTFKDVSKLSIISCASIILAVSIAMIGIGISKPHAGDILAVRPGLPFVKGLGPVLNIILAYTGHVAFLSFQSELRDPRDFKKALFFEQGIAVTFYMTISAVIYYYAGPFVTSPALGSASPVVTKIAFGFAIPTIIISGVVNGSVACKYLYIRMWKGTDVVHQKSFKSIGSWVAICAALWIVAWLLAEAIPNFNLLLGLIAALFGSWFSYALPMVMWFYQYRGSWFKSKRMIVWSICNAFLFCIGVAIFALGMWASGHDLRNGSGGKVFSCANNWSPVRIENDR